MREKPLVKWIIRIRRRNLYPQNATQEFSFGMDTDEEKMEQWSILRKDNCYETLYKIETKHLILLC